MASSTNVQLADRTDAEIFQRVVDGDNDAFYELFRRYNPKLVRYFYRQVNARERIAEDLAQELWERVIRQRGKKSVKEPVDERAMYVQAFLFRIARNLVIDHLRTKKEHSDLESEAERLQAPSSEPSDAEDLVSRAMQSLSFDFREVLELQLHLGYRLDEIAEMLGKSPDAIWARASRARAKLRRLVVDLAKREGVELRHLTRVTQE